MKNFTLLSFVLCVLFLSSCKKENGTYTNTSLTGKWKLDANYIGDGGPTVWITVPNSDDHVVQFNSDGSLGGNMFPGYYSYIVKDSLLTINHPADGIQKYIHTIKHDTLTLSLNGPVLCYEGCAIRFIKVK